MREATLLVLNSPHYASVVTKQAALKLPYQLLTFQFKHAAYNIRPVGYGLAGAELADDFGPIRISRNRNEEDRRAKGAHNSYRILVRLGDKAGTANVGCGQDDALAGVRGYAIGITVA